MSFREVLRANVTHPGQRLSVISPWGPEWRYDLLGRPVVLPPDWDPAGHMKHDGLWWARLEVAEQVEYDGYTVPLYLGDVERAEWLARVRLFYGRPRWLMSRGVSLAN